MAIITPAQVRDHYPGLTGTGEDTRLGVLIDQANGLCAAWAGWPEADAGGHTFESATYTVYADGPDPRQPRRLPLPLRQVASVTTVHSGTQWLYDASELVASDQYVVERGRALLLKSNSTPAAWRSGLRAQRVVAVAGFATAPPALVLAIAEQVRHLLDRPRGGDRASVSRRGGSTSAPEPAELVPQAVQDALGAAGVVVWGSRVG